MLLAEGKALTERLRTYAVNHHADLTRWTFVTGPENNYAHAAAIDSR